MILRTELKKKIPISNWTLLGSRCGRTIVFVILAIAFLSVHAQERRRANPEPAGLAPDPAEVSEAVVQVYAARAWGFRGFIGVHTWIAVKGTDAPAFTVYEVIGWRLRRYDTALSIRERRPDSRWYGSTPELLSDIRGDGVDEIIARIDRAARAYPYARRYRVWPGPNSNTFTAFVLRAAPELRVDLPPTAVGKDYLGIRIIAKAPSGTGFQISLFGLAGILLAIEEGVEVNVLGLTFGIDPKDLALKLPLIGRVSFVR